MRHDAACCRDVAYSALRCKRARDMAAQAVERASFVSGAFRPPAADANARPLLPDHDGVVFPKISFTSGRRADAA